MLSASLADLADHAARLDSVEDRVARLETLEFSKVGMGGCVNLIQRVAVPPAGAAVITFANIPQTYENLWLISYVWRANLALWMRFNNDAGQNYHWRRYTVQWNNIPTDVRNQSDFQGYLTGVDTIELHTVSECLIPRYAKFMGSGLEYKTWKCHNIYWQTIAEGLAWDEYRQDVQGRWSVTPINRIDIFPLAGGLFAPSTFSLYGLC